MKYKSFIYDQQTKTAYVQEKAMFQKGLFRNAYQLKNLVLPKEMTSIPEDFCRHAKSLEHVVFPPFLEEIKAYAFSNCVLLKSIDLPKGLTKIGAYAFAHAKQLEKVVLPEGLLSIEEGAFQGCHALKEIILPDSLISIDAYAFKDCDALERLHFPKNIQHFPLNALPYGGQLKTFTGTPKKAGYTISDLALCSNDGHTLLFYPPNCDLKTCQVPEGITHIADNAFYGAKHLQKMILPSTLRHMGLRVFQKSSVVHVIFQKTPTFAKANAPEDGLFYHCNALKDVSFLEPLAHLPAYMFAYSALKAWQIPERLISIEDGAFYLSSIRELYVPKSVKHIGKYAFYGVDTVHLPMLENLCPLELCLACPKENACSNCSFHFYDRFVFPCMLHSEPSHACTVARKIKVFGETINTMAIDELFTHLTQVEHKIVLALNRLHENSNALPDHQKECYQNFIQQHAVMTAELLIQSKKISLLQKLLQHTHLTLQDYQKLLTLAEAHHIYDAIRLLTLHTPTTSWSFSL